MRSPRVAFRPTDSMSTFWNDIGTIFMPWAASPNSSACLIAVALSPATLMARILAPDDCAWSRNEAVVGRAELGLHAAGDLAARARNAVTRGGFDRMTESVVAGDEEPRVLAGLHDAGDDRGRRGIGVLGPLHAGWRAGFISELVGAGAGDEENLAVAAHQLLHCAARAPELPPSAIAWTPSLNHLRASDAARSGLF